jgi:predicted nucleic acid-binding protein
MRLYLDASAIIYALEGRPDVRHIVMERILQVLGSIGGVLITSRLSVLECRIKPLHEGNQLLLDRYNRFFADGSIHVAETTAAVIDKATHLRAQYRLQTPDAIHAATAIEEHADLFLTGDTTFTRCPEIAVEVVRPLT